MFTKEHMGMELKGVQVQDALTVMQVIRRLVKSGVMEDLELAPLTEIRSKLVRTIQEATGVNYDVAFAQALQTGPAAVAAAGQQGAAGSKLGQDGGGAKV